MKMWKKILTIFLFLLIPLLSFADSWMLELKILYGGYYQRLIAGVQNDATENYDVKWDTPALFWGGEPFQAYFYHPEWSALSSYFWRDVRGDASTIVWTLYVSSKRLGSTFEIIFNFPLAPENAELLFVELDRYGNTINSINIMENNNYTFTMNENMRLFNIVYKKLRIIPPPYILEARRKGNEISLYVSLKDNSIPLKGINVYRHYNGQSARINSSPLPAGEVKDFLTGQINANFRKGAFIWYFARTVDMEGKESKDSNWIPVLFKD